MRSVISWLVLLVLTPWSVFALDGLKRCDLPPPDGCTFSVMDDSAMTLEDISVNIAVRANDVNIQDLYILPNPTHGSVKVEKNLTITYTPNPGFTGTDTFTYDAISRCQFCYCDDVGPVCEYKGDIGTVTVEVKPIVDIGPPMVAVGVPNGGEIWRLSDPADLAHSSIGAINWTMGDDVRICKVEVSLLASKDGGGTYVSAPYSGNPILTFGQKSSQCSDAEKVTSTSGEYTIPAEPPSGSPGSLYKIRVKVFDWAGKTATDDSDKPFLIVRPNEDSIKTLVLWNRERMRQKMALGASELAELGAQLDGLAGEDRVLGRVIDLSGVSALDTLYAAWDADPGNAAKANAVVLELHAYLESVSKVFTGVDYLILVGDDRIIPMARLADKTLALPESTYSEGVNDDTAYIPPGLTPTGTTVGQAIAAGLYLSDDPLAVRGAVTDTDLSTIGVLFIPDYAIGRLVETPQQITAAIAAFISRAGIVDLADPRLHPLTGHKVQVTGYDFLVDSAQKIYERWKSVTDVSFDPLAPVDGELISHDWGESTVVGRQSALETHLGGNGGDPYGVISLNGHAAHYEEGVPGANPLDIQGLSSARIAALGLGGTVIYSVGCHSGLSVAGSTNGADHPLDLPETFLGRGVLAYVGNTGYGWGFREGIGLAERLAEIMTETLTEGGTVTVGDAVRRSKIRYINESPRFDTYDAKTLMQWTLFGFPMTALKTDVPVKAAPSRSVLDDGRELVDGVKVNRRLGDDFEKASLPSYLTRLELDFDITAEGVFAKRTAAGDLVPETTSGCPSARGCYYTLNGLSTGESDLPIEPYFVYEARLSGTSQHGILWKGSTFEDEESWRPVFAQLASNGPIDDRGISIPTTIYLPPDAPPDIGSIGGDEPAACRGTDELLTSIVFTTGETRDVGPIGSPQWQHRLHREEGLEVFYYNNTRDSLQNCDRRGPVFGAGPHHTVFGTTVVWSVDAMDGEMSADPQQGVWRVVVVYDDGTRDAEGRGRWAPLDLDYDGTAWRGSVDVLGSSRLTYYLQAVDFRGNVGWLEYEAPVPPSGVPLGIPRPIEVAIEPSTADLALEVGGAPDPVMIDELLQYTITTASLGPDAAIDMTLTAALGASATPVVGGGAGWQCDQAGQVMTCTRSGLGVGESSQVDLVVRAPATAGPLTSTFTATAANDPTPTSATKTIEVVDEPQTPPPPPPPSADLAIAFGVDPQPVGTGAAVAFTATVENLGPNVAELVEVSLDPLLGGGDVTSATGEGWECGLVEPADRWTCTMTAVGIGVAPPIVFAVTVPDSTTRSTLTVQVASSSDPNPGNDVAAATVEVIEGLILFDGFESGDCTRWSSPCP